VNISQPKLRSEKFEEDDDDDDDNNNNNQSVTILILPPRFLSQVHTVYETLVLSWDSSWITKCTYLMKRLITP